MTESGAWRIDAIEIGHWRYTLQQAVGGSGVRFVDLVTATVTDGEGAEGLGFGYVLGAGGAVPYVAALDIAARLRGSHVDSPMAVWKRTAAGLNRLGKGPNFIGLAAIDLAIWDVQAKRANLPLGRLLGSAGTPMQVYGSGFFHAEQSPAEAAKSAARYLASGAKAVKPRVSGRASDRALIAEISRSLPSDAQFMLDANEKCDLASALVLCRSAAEHGAVFVEEALPSDAIAAYRILAAKSPVALALGEHLQGAAEFAHFLGEPGVTVIQPDLAMAGGFTGCLLAAEQARQAGRIVAPHFLPDLFIHLSGALPNFGWLEHFPLLEPLFEEAHGADRFVPTLEIPDRPGHGLRWVEDVKRRVEILA